MFHWESALIGLGSRFVIAAEVASLVLLLEKCSQAPCVSEESGCGSGGVGGGVDQTECNDGPCGEVFAGQCAVAFGCYPQWDEANKNDYDQCFVWESTPGEDDKNACTHDVCENDEWVHTPFSAEEIDDGDPCTIDECDSTIGVYHVQSCG